MNRDSWTGLVKWLGVALLVLLLAMACTAAPEAGEMEEAEIYAAVIRRIYTRDDTFGGGLQAPTVYLVATTDDSAGDPAAGQSESQTLSEAAQAAIVERLADLPAEFVWVGERSEVPLDDSTGAVAGGGVIFTLGNIHRQDDGSVQVAGSIYVAMLAAGGQTYILEPAAGGGWEITGTTGVAWMS